MTGPAEPATTHGHHLVSAGDQWVLGVDRATGRVTVNGVLQPPQRRAVLAGWLAEPLTLDQVVTAYAEAGDRALPHLRGQFALAILEPASSGVTVVRDPTGVYPLFYAVTASTVWCSNAVDCLLDQPGVSAELNRLAIADHVCKRWPVSDETFFESVRRVLPASFLRVRGGVVTTTRYWHPAGDRIDWLPDDEDDQFDQALDQAVARGLRGQTAVFLSGGFDSVSVAAVATDLARQKGAPVPRALSIGFPDPECDEQHIQSPVAGRLGLEMDLVPFAECVAPEGLLARGLALNASLPAPLLNAWTPAYLSLVRRGRAAGVDTIYTGEGGDEWLGNSPFLAADYLRRGHVRGLWNLTRTWRRSYPQGLPTVLRDVVWTFGLRPLIGQVMAKLDPVRWDDRRAERAMEGRPDWIAAAPDLRRAQFERARAALVDANPRDGFYVRELWGTLDSPLQTRVFEEQFEMGRRAGVDFVHPYWDPDLIANICRINPVRLDAGHRSKALVRRTLATRFPGLGFERQRKAVAMQFFAGLVRREAPVLAANVSDFRGLASLGVVEPRRAAAFVGRALAGSVQEVGWAWNLVNTESWVRHALARRRKGSG